MEYFDNEIIDKNKMMLIILYQIQIMKVNYRRSRCIRECFRLFDENDLGGTILQPAYLPLKFFRVYV